MDQEKKAELEQELRNNIEEIKKYFPDFEMTEEQIQSMLSDERIAIHEKYKNSISQHDPSIRDGVLQDEFLLANPDGYRPPAFDRNFFHVVKIDGSEESREFNKKMFGDIGRDDKRGEVARENYLLYCLNLNKKIDLSKFEKDVSEADFIEYAVQNCDLGGVTMETDNFISKYTELKVNDDAKGRLTHFKSIGESAGGAMRGIIQNIKEDGFFTMPVRFLNSEQIKKLINIPSFTKYNLQMTLEFNRLQMQSGLDNCKGIDYPDFTMNDFTYTVPESKRCPGGYEFRFNAAMEAVAFVEGVENRDDMPELRVVKESFAKLKNLLENIGLDPSPEDAKALTSLAKNTKEEFLAVHLKYSNRNDYPEQNKVYKLMLGAINGISIFADEAKTKALIRYAIEDKNALDKTDSFKLMEEKISELNDMMASFRVADKYGQNPQLSQEDIFDLKSKLAEVQTLASLAAESTADPQQKNIAESILDRTRKEGMSLSAALPGMTLDEGLSLEGLTIDLTGHTLDRVGNSVSSRQKMTITGPDGRQLKGFFTEKTTLNLEEGKKDIISKVSNAHPEYKELISQIVEIEFSDIPFNQKEERRAALLNPNGEPMLPEIQSVYDETMEFCKRQIKIAGIYEAMLLDRSSSRVENRNIAMSDVAELLGQSDILAKSRKMTIVDNGVKIEGCFMENVKGDDIDHIYKDSHFLDIKPGYADYSPALKQMADMQVIDYICGNIDRHAGNIFYEFDENNRLIGVKGIDNDMAFFTKNANEMMNDRFVHPDEMGVISESMADMVKKLDAGTLKYVLNQRKICEEGVNKAVDRLNEMKEAIENKIVEIMPDKEFENRKLDELASKTSGKNIFKIVESSVKRKALNLDENKKNRIRNTEDNKPQKKEPEPLKSFVGTRASLVQQDSEQLTKLLQKVGDAQKNVSFGSAIYDKIEESLMALDNFAKKAKGKHVFSVTEIQQYNNSYKALSKMCKEYMSRKQEKSFDSKTKEYVLKTKKLGVKTQKRYNAIRDIKFFCDKRIEHLNNTLAPKNDMLAMKEESDRIQIGAFKENPKLAGELLKGLVTLSNKNMDNLHMQANIAGQMNIIFRFINETNMKPGELSVTSEDLKTAMSVVKRGREANAQLKGVVKTEQKAVEKPKTELII